MKSIKRFFAGLMLVVLALLLSYLVYTAKTVASLPDAEEMVHWVGGCYG